MLSWYPMKVNTDEYRKIAIAYKKSEYILNIAQHINSFERNIFGIRT